MTVACQILSRVNNMQCFYKVDTEFHITLCGEYASRKEDVPRLIVKIWLIFDSHFNIIAFLKLQEWKPYSFQKSRIPSRWS